MRRVLFAIIFLLALVVGLYLFAPWKPWVAGQVRQVLARQGVEVSQLTLAEVAADSVLFRDVALQSPLKLTVPRLRIHFTWDSLTQQRVEHIELQGLHYRWQAAEGAESGPFLLPFITREQLEALPFSRLEITDSQLEWQTAELQGSTGWSATLIPKAEADSPHLTATLEQFRLNAGEETTLALETVELASAHSLTNGAEAWQLKLSVPQISGEIAKTKFNAAQWRGHVTLSGPPESPRLSAKLQAEAPIAVRYQSQDFTLKGAQLSVRQQPDGWQFEGKAAQLAEQGSGSGLIWLPITPRVVGSWISGTLTAQLNAQHAQYALQTGLVRKDSAFYLDKPQVTLGQGRLSAPKVTLGKESGQIQLSVSNLALEEVLKFALPEDQQIQATGRLEGTVPIRWGKRLAFGEGTLKSLSKGTLSLGEKNLQALPGHIEQVKQVKQLLNYFEYDTLQIETFEKAAEKAAGKDGGLGIRVKLKGRNPQVYEGAEVHLNINLQGDVQEALNSALGIYDFSNEWLNEVKNANETANETE